MDSKIISALQKSLKKRPLFGQEHFSYNPLAFFLGAAMIQALSHAACRSGGPRNRFLHPAPHWFSGIAAGGARDHLEALI